MHSHEIEGWWQDVTVRVTTLKGAGAGDYYLEGGGLPGYYVDVDEPRGVWFGRGTEWLGLDGEVDDDRCRCGGRSATRSPHDTTTGSSAPTKAT